MTLDRFHGCLLGLAAGDALGTTVEFLPPGMFEPLADIVGGGPFRLAAGQWTDDTSMALCLATSLVELGQGIVEDDVVLIEDYAYPAYGVPSEETKEAIRLCARLEGMITDPVYEGKSMQGMIDLVNKGYFPKGSKVLYAHLGGAPAIKGYAYAFRNG